MQQEETLQQRVILPETLMFLQQLLASEKQDLTSLFATYGFPPELLTHLSEETPHVLALDALIDLHMISRLKSVKIPYKCEHAKQKFINYLLDIQNIKHMLRAKHLGYTTKESNHLFLGEGQEISTWKYTELSEVETVEQVISNLEGTTYFTNLKDSIEAYNKDNSIQAFEQALDRVFLKIIRELSTQYYTTIGPTIRFLISKEIETNNLKIIAKGIEEHLSSDRIKQFFVTETTT
jgi:V/A-type H+-transporting ATPase subunit C